MRKNWFSFLSVCKMTLWTQYKNGILSFFFTEYSGGNVGNISCIFRLSELLEAPHITKVMHASSVDCMSAYKDGVNIWGLYDTAVAHRVLQLQTSGRLGPLLLCPVFLLLCCCVLSFSYSAPVSCLSATLLLWPVFLLPLVSFSDSVVDPYWFQYGSGSRFLHQFESGSGFWSDLVPSVKVKILHEIYILY